MKIFIAYASEDKTIAESIAFSIRARGHKVFFDRDDLPVAESYDSRIEFAVKQSDVFVFLISPDSVTDGAYTLTELSFARRKWLDPNGRVLPVMVRQTPVVPPYLSAVTILKPEGNVPAETSAAVDGMSKQSKDWNLQTTLGVSCIASTLSVFNVHFDQAFDNVSNYKSVLSLWLIPALISGLIAGMTLLATKDSYSVLIIIGCGVLYIVLVLIENMTIQLPLFVVVNAGLAWSVGFAVFYYGIALASGGPRFSISKGFSR